MTHDPREALEPCPFCGGEAERIDIPTVGSDPDLGGDPNAGGSCIQCKRCTASTALHFDRKENLYSSWNDRMAGVAEQSGAGAAPETSVRCGAPAALTASPGEQQPVAWRWRAKGSNGSHTFSETEPVPHPDYLTEPLYTSPPPAAGWDVAVGDEATKSEADAPPFGGYGSIKAAIDAADANARTCKGFATALERIRDGEPNASQIALDALRMPWHTSGVPSDPTADRREIVALDRQFIIDLIREKYDPVPRDRGPAGFNPAKTINEMCHFPPPPEGKS